MLTRDRFGIAQINNEKQYWRQLRHKAKMKHHRCRHYKYKRLREAWFYNIQILILLMTYRSLMSKGNFPPLV